MLNLHRHRLPRGVMGLLLAMPAAVAFAAESGGPAHERAVTPLLERYCYQCHGLEDEAGELDLRHAVEQGLSTQPQLLDELLAVVEFEEMPPRDVELQPSADERAAMVASFEATLDHLRRRRRDDPGTVVMPRLSRAEYDRVIRDLSGHDLNPARFLPGPLVAGEGFTNVGAAHGTTQGDIERYLSAADQVVSHLRVSPVDGPRWFADAQQAMPDPATHRAELMREIEAWYRSTRHRHIVEHLERLESELGDEHRPYLEAAWFHRHHSALGLGDDLAAIAERWRSELGGEEALHPGILRKWIAILAGDEPEQPLLAQAVRRWRAIPDPASLAARAQTADGAGDDAGDERADAAADDAEARAGAQPFAAVGAGCQAICDDWAHVRRYYALNRRFDHEQDRDNHRKEGWFGYRIAIPADANVLYLVATDAWDGDEVVIWRAAEVRFDDDSTRPLAELSSLVAVDGDGRALALLDWGTHVEGHEIAADAVGVRSHSQLRIDVPAGARELSVEVHLDPAYNHDRNATVQTMVLTEPVASAEHLHFYPGRRVWSLDDSDAGGRAYADYYFLRNITQARDHKLGLGGRTEINLILPFVDVAARHLGGPWDGEPEAEDANPYRYPPAQLQREFATATERERLAVLYRDLESAAQPAHQDLLALLVAQGVEEPAEGVLPAEDIVANWDAPTRARYRELAEAVRTAEDERTAAARRWLHDLADTLWRRPVGEGEIDELLTLYRRERARGASFDAAIKVPILAILVSPHFLYRHQPARGEAEPYPIADVALASRLSFFLWGSMPDRRLRDLAAAGELNDPATLRAEARRMLADPRARALAVEFAGRWLDVADIADHTSPDTERFPAYTPSLRAAMHEETVRFFLDLFRDEAPLTDLVGADYVWVNEELAALYGIAGVEGAQLRRVAAGETPRGGVVTMGAVLTKTSESLRTSPVLRGAWMVERLLGEHLPEPPANVPMISMDDVDEHGVAVREQLRRHREDPSCAACHARIDPLGVALEHFDPIGAWREVDSADNPIDAAAQLGERPLHGVEALRTYLWERRDDVVETFCEKLLGYALGRELDPGDDALLERIHQALREHDHRFGAALELIVTSPQFRLRRDGDQDPREGP